MRVLEVSSQRLGEAFIPVLASGEIKDILYVRPATPHGHSDAESDLLLL